MTNKLIGIIPARSGSKRLPNKNLQLFGGNNLLEHSIFYAANSGIKDCFVSTDGLAIKEATIKAGAKVIDRPHCLATDNTSTLELLQHAIGYLNITEGWVVLLQPTNPLRPEGLLQLTLEKIEHTGADSILGESYPYHVKNDDSNKTAAIIESLYKLWKTKDKNLTLNKPDLLDYLGLKYLEI